MPNLNELRADFEKEAGYAPNDYKRNDIGEYVNDWMTHLWMGYQVGARRQHGSAAQAVAPCAHKFVRDDDSVRHECCQLCGAVRSDTAPPVADAEGVTPDDVAEAVRAYVAAGKRGCGLMDAMKCAVEAALSRRPAAAADQANPTAQEIRAVAAEQPAAEPELLPLPTLPQYLLNRIADYGLARTEGLFETDRLNLWASIIDCIKAYASAYARAHLRAAGQGNKDSERLDWLSENYFHIEMDDFDQKSAPTSDTWRFFLPKKAVGTLRERLDAAIDAAKAKGEHA